MRKNIINWKRTPLGTTLEVLLPVLLTIALAVARRRVQPQLVTNLDLQNLRHPLYPIASLQANNTWKIDSFNGSTADSNMQAFMRYANYTNLNSSQYVPLLDPLGPYLFFPQHCYADDSEQKFGSPLIGYIQTNSQLEQDLIGQLQLLFQYQQTLVGSNKMQASTNQSLQNFQNTIQNIASKASSSSFSGGPSSFGTNTNGKGIGNFTLKSFPSQSAFDDYIRSANYGQSEKPGICFGFKASQNKQNNSYELELMFNDQSQPEYRSIPSQQVQSASPTQYLPLFSEYSDYSWKGFAYLQNWAANSILKRKSGVSSASIVVMTVPMSTSAYQKDDFQFVMQISLTAIVFLMYIPPLYRTVFRIVVEKESKVKESMRMMGMTDISYWLSWFTYYSCINFLVSTLSWLVLNFAVFRHSNGFLVWILLWLFGQSLFSLIMLAQSLFSRARQAAYVTTCLYFGLAMLQFLVNDPRTDYYKKVLASFSPTVALSQSLVILIQFETSGFGLSFQNVNRDFQNYNFSIGLIMIVADTILWFIVGVYFEAVLPKEFGQRRHPCFCFRNRRAISKTQNEVHIEISECFEEVSRETSQKPNLTISQLYKSFDNQTAINGLNCQFYQDQIFVLLGHNGAGKTTTINVLTGLLEPTSYQTMTVFGLKIVEQMQQVREILGVCPQHDILFELLTPAEHLDIFYDFRTSDNTNKKQQNQKLIEDVGLNDKKSTLAYQLSGGNKRKLSVAIALCGNSKFVLLDEPTSGMDIQTRRQLWNTLREYRQGRIIILTTHYMDEADVLGDRIGIMCRGKLTCLGSPLFLKNRFGVGYNLNIIKQNNSKGNKFEDYIQRMLSTDAYCISEVENELIYLLPQQLSNNFEAFFNHLDLNLQNLGIQSYGVSVSTLEEIFLKIGHLDDPLSILRSPVISSETPNTGQSGDNEKNQSEGPEKRRSLTYKEKDHSMRTNLIASIQKRFWIYKHNKKAIFTESVYPAAVMIYGVLLTQFIYTARSPSRFLNPNFVSQIKNEHIVFNSLTAGKTNQDSFKISEMFKDQFQVSYINSSNWNSMNIELQNYGKQQIFDYPYLYGAYDFFNINKTTQTYQIYNYLNLTGQDVAALYPQYMYERILKLQDANLDFKTKTTPYPPTNSQAQSSRTTSAGTIIFMTAVAYSTLMTMICSFVVNERISGLKHLQIISGLQLKSYWLGNFVFDLLKMYLTVIVTIVLLWSFDMGYTGCQFCFIVFPFAVLPFTYVFSFVFKSEASSQTYVMFGYLMTILTLPTLMFVFRTMEGMETISDVLHWIFRLLLPTYCLGSSIYLDQSADLISDIRFLRSGKVFSKDIWNINNVLGDLVCLVFQTFMWFLVLYIIENKVRNQSELTQQQSQSEQLTNRDSDVIMEAERIKQPNLELALKVQDFCKTYEISKRQRCKTKNTQSVIAVQNLSFGINKGECFSLLGVNGAGKSTTFKVLTGEIQASRGIVEIQSKNVCSQFQDVKTMLGYCPQWNCIFETMTVEEHMFFYAKTKGIPTQAQQSLIDDIIKNLGLQNHRFKLAGNLSGGNKRKLSVAIAIIGRPPLILLDEPSAGMDPEARRLMWRVVASLQKDCAVVFTTHDMEEAEALSTKLGIMTKGGVLRCLGSAQHIRHKYGQGYIIQIKTKECSESTEQDQNLSKLDPNQKAVLIEFCQAFGGKIDCLERYGTFMKLRLSKDQDQVSLGKVFGVIESMKRAGKVDEYSVNQTTLEQIFQTFANLDSKSQICHYELQDGGILIESNQANQLCS